MLYVYSSAWLQSWQLARYSIHAALGKPVSSPAMVQDDQPWKKVWCAELTEYSLDRLCLQRCMYHKKFSMPITTVTSTQNRESGRVQDLNSYDSVQILTRAYFKAIHLIQAHHMSEVTTPQTNSQVLSPDYPARQSHLLRQTDQNRHYIPICYMSNFVTQWRKKILKRKQKGLT